MVAMFHKNEPRSQQGSAFVVLFWNKPMLEFGESPWSSRLSSFCKAWGLCIGGASAAPRFTALERKMATEGHSRPALVASAVHVSLRLASGKSLSQAHASSERQLYPCGFVAPSKGFAAHRGDG